MKKKIISAGVIMLFAIVLISTVPDIETAYAKNNKVLDTTGYEWWGYGDGDYMYSNASLSGQYLKEYNTIKMAYGEELAFYDVMSIEAPDFDTTMGTLRAVKLGTYKVRAIHNDLSVSTTTIKVVDCVSDKIKQSTVSKICLNNGNYYITLKHENSLVEYNYSGVLFMTGNDQYGSIIGPSSQDCITLLSGFGYYLIVINRNMHSEVLYNSSWIYFNKE